MGKRFRPALRSKLLLGVLAASTISICSIEPQLQSKRTNYTQDVSPQMETHTLANSVKLSSSNVALMFDVSFNLKHWKRRRRWGGNGSSSYAYFNDTRRTPGTQYPGLWLKRKFPFISHVRLGNFIYGHCDVPKWANDLNLQEVLLDDSTSNWQQTFEFLKNVKKSGVLPHITFTGTPKALAPPDWECSAYSRIANPPRRSEKFEWQNQVVGSFMRQAITEWGKEELKRWHYSTWTEPNFEGHFNGSEVQASEMIRMTLNIMRANNIPLRIGNFAGLSHKEDPKYIKGQAILEVLQARNVDLNSEFSGAGLSLYHVESADSSKQKGFPELERAIDHYRQLLNDAGGSWLRIHVDELGWLTQKFGNHHIPVFRGGPDLVGAAKYLTSLRMLDRKGIGRRNFWHQNFYLADGSLKHPANWLKTAKYNAVDMLDRLRNQNVVAPLGEEVLRDITGKRTGEIRGFASFDPESQKMLALVFRHTYDADDEAEVIDKQVCFRGLEPNQRYRYFLYTINQDRGNGMGRILAGGDYREKFNRSSRKWEWEGAFSQTPEEILTHQMHDDYFLESSFATSINGQGQKCFAINLQNQSIFLMELLPVITGSPRNFRLDFQKDLLSQSGATPISATGISYERGVSNPENRSPGFHDPGKLWSRYRSENPTRQSGHEAVNAAYFPAGSRLTYAYRYLPSTSRGEVRFWLRPNWNHQSSGGQDRHLFSWENQVGKNEIRLEVVGSNHLRAIIFIDGVRHALQYQVKDWQAGKWEHIRLRWNENGLRLFVRNELVASKDSVNLEALKDKRGLIRIGSVNGNRAAEAVLDEVRLEAL